MNSVFSWSAFSLSVLAHTTVCPELPSIHRSDDRFIYTKMCIYLFSLFLVFSPFFLLMFCFIFSFFLFFCSHLFFNFSIVLVSRLMFLFSYIFMFFTFVLTKNVIFLPFWFFCLGVGVGPSFSRLGSCQFSTRRRKGQPKPKKRRVMMNIITKNYKFHQTLITKMRIIIKIKFISEDGGKKTGVGPSGWGRPWSWGLVLPSWGWGWPFLLGVGVGLKRKDKKKKHIFQIFEKAEF